MSASRQGEKSVNPQTISAVHPLVNQFFIMRTSQIKCLLSSNEEANRNRATRSQMEQKRNSRLKFRSDKHLCKKNRASYAATNFFSEANGLSLSHTCMSSPSWRLPVSVTFPLEIASRTGNTPIQMAVIVRRSVVT